MVNKVVYAPLALQDMEDILEYSRDNFYDPETARKIVAHLIATANSLKQFPERGTPLGLIGEVAHIEDKYRFLVSDNYLIFYRYVRGCVFVDRILYKHRNYLEILFHDD